MSRSITALSVSVDALRVNPLRTILSTLGVIMGVGSMVSVLAMGDGVERYAREALSRTTDLQTATISPIAVQRLDGIFVRRNDVVQFTVADAAELRAMVPEAHGAQLVQAGGTIAQRDSAARPRGMVLTGGMTALFASRKLTAAQGALFTDADVADSAHVVVLSASAADTLLGIAAADSLTRGSRAAALVGTTLLLQRQPYRVLGVLAPEEKGRAELFIPITATGGVLSMLGGPAPGAHLLIDAARVEDVPVMVQHAERWTARRYGMEWKQRVSVTANSDRVRQLTQALNVFRILMSAITGVSLLVGGVGIMNVLLASVAERTREIGIRKAAGARNRDILVQFLGESVAITCAGAALGVALGLGIAFFAAAIMRSQTEAQVHAAVSLTTVLTAAIASVSIGVLFGLYPALRAARISPIDAIRHE